MNVKPIKSHSAWLDGLREYDYFSFENSKSIYTVREKTLLYMIYQDVETAKVFKTYKMQRSVSLWSEIIIYQGTPYSKTK